MSGQNGVAIHQDHVAAYAKCWRGEGYVYCVLGGGGTGHQCGARDEAGAMELCDCAIDTAGQTKVVCIDDELAHPVSLSIRGECDAGM